MRAALPWLLVLAGIVAWGYAVVATGTWQAVVLFALGATCLVTGWVQGRGLAPRTTEASGEIPALAAGARLGEPPARRVDSRTFRFERGSRFLSSSAATSGVVALAGVPLVFADATRVLGTTLAITGAALAALFGAGLFFNRRMHLRVDGEGLHSGSIFGESTVRWQDVEALRIEASPRGGRQSRSRRVVVSPGRRVRYPEAMQGSGELSAAIEEATGLAWQRSDG